jgi:hypothetical protein
MALHYHLLPEAVVLYRESLYGTALERCRAASLYLAVGRRFRVRS